MQKIQQFFKKPRALQILVALVVGLMGALWLPLSHAAGSATLSLSPASSSINLGSTFTVTIVENSGTVGVNAVEADLTYDQTKLQFVSIDTSTTPFSLVASSGGGNGTVSIGNASTTPQTGQQTVAIVTFTAIGTGSTNVAFAATSGVAQASDNTNTLASTVGATYTIADKTAPSVPTGLTNTTATVNSLAVSWTASTDNVGVIGYKIYSNGTQVATTAGTSYTLTGLTPKTTYSITVAAYDAAGNTSTQSTAGSFATLADTTAPSAPAGLTAGTKTLTSISMTWSASTDNVGVIGYKIYRGGTQIATSATPSYTNSGLTPGTTYSYTVAAYDAAGNTSTQSTAGSFATLADTTAPSVPTGLTLITQNTTSLTISWTASTDNVGVTGYKIYRGGTQVGTATTPSYTLTGLTSGTSYSIVVSAYDATGNVSAQSAASTFSTTTLPGDANGDGTVNYLDLSILANSWLSTTNLKADFNHDGVVNFLDLSILASNWGK